MRQIDWHMHTLASDGFFRPENLVVLVKELDVNAAIADHDTVKGNKDALKKAEELGYPIVSGIELSTFIGKPVHILGYGIDPDKLDTLEAELKEVQEKRSEKVKKMLEEVHKEGVWQDINFDELRGKNAYSAYISRIHVAAELYERGHYDNVLDALDDVNRMGLYQTPEFRSPVNGLELLRKYCKVISLAHLTSLHMEDFEEERLVREFKDQGLTAIEAISSKYDDARIIRYVSLAKRSGLRITVGSDFHWEKSTPYARIGLNLDAVLTDEILQALEMRKEEVYELVVDKVEEG